MREYLLVFLVAAGMTYLLTVVAREIAVRTKALAVVRDRDVHDEPIPYLGGLAMLGGLVAAIFVSRELPFLSLISQANQQLATTVLVAGAMICGVGVLDDIFELDALTKFGGQLLAAGYRVINNVQYNVVPLPDNVQFSLDPTQGALLTVFIVVATVNAVNFVDGLDGLAAGVIGAGAVAFFVYCYQLSTFNEVSLATTGALLAAALAGACAGFLPHNFHPARLFMGDSGSMLLGLTLSASAITVTSQFAPGDLVQGAGDREASLLPIYLLPALIPLSILVVPLADLTLAVVRRTRAGRSPFSPDKQHLHHRMLEIGHSHRRAVLILWAWAGLVGSAITLSSLYAGPKLWIGVGTATLVTLLATFGLPYLQKPAILDGD